jgi:hypothetical protein
MEKRSAKYNIYKKSAAAQISLLSPVYEQEGWIKKEGGVLFEVALQEGTDTSGNNTYNWKEKISFSFGMNDLALFFGDPETRLVHEYQDKTKTFQLTAGKDKYEGTFMLKVTEKGTTGTTRSVSVPISGGEAALLNKLLTYAAPKIIGW